MARKVFLYTLFIDRIIFDLPSSKGVGGANLQLSFWAVQLSADFRVFTFAQFSSVFHSTKNKYELKFVYLPFILFLRSLFLRFKFLALLFVRPDIVILRGHDKDFYRILRLKKFLAYKFIYMVASDNDISFLKNFLNFNKNSSMTFLGNQFIDLLVVQNQYQYSVLSNLHTNVILVQNLYLPVINPRCPPKFSRLPLQIDFLWVSNVRKAKNPFLLIDIAKAYPNFNFVVVGDIDSSLKSIFPDEFYNVPNISYLGSLKPSEVLYFMGRTKYFITTSYYEGFPNNYLMAWSLGVPVFSTVDPNNYISEFNLGFIFHSIDEFITLFDNFVSNTDYTSLQLHIIDFFNKFYLGHQEFYISKFKHELENLFL